MKYFAVDSADSNNLLNTLIDMRAFPLPKFYQLQFARLYENTLSSEDYAFIRLKFTTINPTRKQLELANKIHELDLNLDEYPEE